jgi:hypothetical protein
MGSKGDLLMAFEINKMNKLSDQLEAHAYDWVMTEIESQFDVTDTEDLTDEQILEISDYLNSGVHIESYCEMILNDIVNNREIEE